MSDKLRDDFNLVAKVTLESIGDIQVVQPHLNQEYNAQLLQSINVGGAKNRSITVLVDKRSKPANVFNGEIVIDSIKEAEITFSVSDLLDKSFGFTYDENEFRPDVVKRAVMKGVRAIVEGVEIAIAKEFYNNPKVIGFENDEIKTTEDLARLGRCLSDELGMDNNGGNVALFINSRTSEKLQGHKALYNYSAKGKEYFDRGFVTKSGVSRGGLGAGNGYLFTYDSADFYRWNLLQRLKTDAGIKDVTIDYAGDVSLTDIEGVVTVISAQSAGDVTIPKGIVIAAGKNRYVTLKAIKAKEAGTKLEVGVDINSHSLNDDIVEAAEVELYNLTKYNNVAINKDAVWLAMFTPDLVHGTNGQGTATDPNTGIGVRVTYGYDIKSKSSILSVDCMVAVLNADEGVVVF